MKITNSEYNTIIRALDCYANSKITEEAYPLKAKLVKEYNRLAEKNIEEGMTADEEEIYPSRMNTEYGGSPIGDKKVE